MLRTLRRRLRRIRYYSANAEETPWTRASDSALFITFALALPAVALCDLLVIRPSVAIERQGALEKGLGGDVTAVLSQPDEPPSWTRQAIGYFTVQVIEESRGWPVITSTSMRPARLEYDLFDEPEDRLDRGRAEDQPLRDAVDAALVLQGEEQVLRFWRADTSDREIVSLSRGLVGSGLWWVVLYISAMAMLGASRLGAALWERQSTRRARQMKRAGLCVHCGYDLRGTEFSDRCPECGELA